MALWEFRLHCLVMILHVDFFCIASMGSLIFFFAHTYTENSAIYILSLAIACKWSGSLHLKQIKFDTRNYTSQITIVFHIWITTYVHSRTMSRKCHQVNTENFISWMEISFGKDSNTQTKTSCFIIATIRWCLLQCGRFCIGLPLKNGIKSHINRHTNTVKAHEKQVVKSGNGLKTCCSK